MVASTASSKIVSPFRSRKSSFIAPRASQQLIRLSELPKKGLNSVSHARPGTGFAASHASTRSAPNPITTSARSTPARASAASCQPRIGSSPRTGSRHFGLSAVSGKSRLP